MVIYIVIGAVVGRFLGRSFVSSKSIEKNLNEDSAAKTLLAKSGNVNARDDEGNTALMLSARESSTEILNSLIEKGVDVNEKNKHGFTALMLAARRRHIDIVQILLDRGADINAKNKLGRTALWLAKGEIINKPVIKLLKKHGAAE